MKLKKLTGIFLILTACVYVLALLGNVLLFVLFIPVACVILLFATLSCSADFVYRKKHKGLALLLCGGFLILGGWIINHFFLPDFFRPISLIGNIIILSFTIFLGLTLLDPKRKNIAFAGTAVFIVVISFLYGFGPHIKIANASKETPERELKSLPYLSFVVNEKAAEQEGVIKHNPDLSYPGLNLYNSFSPHAYLMDMSGKVVHSWVAPDTSFDWNQTHFTKGRDLLVSIRDEMVLSLDWQSNVNWKAKIRSHHDVAADEKGRVYALSRKDAIIFVSGLPVPILNDRVVVLSPEGELEKEIPFSKLVRNHISFSIVADLYTAMLNPAILYKAIGHKIESGFALNHDTRFDIFHNNTISVIDRDIEGLCKKGNLLVSVREFDLIGIIDVETENLLWSWGPGILDKQHHPTLLDNGNILVFDNGRRKQRSRVLEMNPRSGEIVWQYASDSPSKFYSSLMGGAQRLPNGNTLITESDKGRAFEVTPDGEVVWEFYNPERRHGKRSVIYRMIRITDSEQVAELTGAN